MFFVTIRTDMIIITMIYASWYLIFTFVTNSYIIILSTKKENRMTIFKKDNFNEASDTYYYAYKAELEQKKVNKKIFSLNNIIKLEFFTLLAGFVFMSSSHFMDNFSIEIQSNIFKSNMVESNINSFETQDITLMAQLEQEIEKNIPLEIKEETSIDAQVAILSKRLNINVTDMTVLVNVIKSQTRQSSKTIKEDKIIISQI